MPDPTDPPTHDFLILVHAVAATLALATALLGLRWPRVLAAHVVLMALMTITLGLALAVGDTGGDTGGATAGGTGGGTRPPALDVVFVGLLVLAAAMTVRSVLAWRSRPSAGAPGGPAHVSHLGFALIGLTTGFLAIAVLRLEWGVAPVVAVGVLTPLIGRRVVGRVVRRRERGGAAPEHRPA